MVFWMRPEKPKPHVTVGVDKDPSPSLVQRRWKPNIGLMVTFPYKANFLYTCIIYFTDPILGKTKI
jgi:hypothetical protein